MRDFFHYTILIFGVINIINAMYTIYKDKIRIKDFTLHNLNQNKASYALYKINFQKYFLFHFHTVKG